MIHSSRDSESAPQSLLAFRCSHYPMIPSRVFPSLLPTVNFLQGKGTGARKFSRRLRMAFRSGSHAQQEVGDVSPDCRGGDLNIEGEE